jgi:hypothetical protein
MNTTRSLLLAMMLACTLAHAEHAPFPSAPPTLAEAEAAKLERVTGKELKALFPAAIEQERARGGRVVKEFKADGTIHANVQETARKGGTGNWSSTWRLDKKKGGPVYCIAPGAGNKGGCFAVFKAGDGVHYFDYSIQDGFYDGAWRMVKN